MKKATEEALQASIVNWFKINYCQPKHNPQLLIHSVPNEGKTTGRYGQKLKYTGRMKGVSDLIVYLPNKILLIEVKLPKKYQTKEQVTFEQRVTDLGFDYYIVRSLEEFKLIITEEL